MIGGEYLGEAMFGGRPLVAHVGVTTTTPPPLYLPTTLFVAAPSINPTQLTIAGFPMPPTVKQYDTYPPWIFAMNDDEGPIPLSGAYAVRIYMKQVSGSAAIGPCVGTVSSESTITANTTAGSPYLTSLSSLAGLIEGSTLVGPGIPPNAVVTEIDQYGGTVTMNVPATATATLVTLTINRGMVSYTPTTTDTATPGVYNVEAAIHWDSANTLITKVPNQQTANPQFQIDPDITGTATE